MDHPRGGLSALDLAASVVLATLALLAYQIASTPIMLLALVVFLVVAYRAPTAGLFAVILALPYYFEPRTTFRGLAFSAAEVGAVMTSLAALPRLIPLGLAELRSLVRQGLGTWLRAAWEGWGWIALGGVVLVVLGFISLGVSARLEESLRSLRTIVVEPVALLFVALYAPDLGARTVGRQRAAWLAGAIVLSGALTSALGLWQIAAHDDHLVTAEDGLIRIRGLYGSPNNLALFLDRAFPLATCVFLFSRSAWRWPAGLAMLLIAAALFLTYSVGAWVALPIALLIVAAIRGRRVLYAYVGAGIVVALASLPFLLRIERFTSHLELTGGTNVFRLAVWSAALAMIRDHPIFGIGLDNFLYYYRDLGYMPPSGAGDPNLSHPHNLIFDFWLSLGFLGLVLAAILLWRFGARSLRSYREAFSVGSWTAPVILGLIGGMSATVLHGLLDNSYFLPDLSVLFWMLFAVLALADPKQAALAQDASVGRANRPTEEAAA